MRIYIEIVHFSTYLTRKGYEITLIIVGGMSKHKENGFGVLGIILDCVLWSLPRSQWGV